MSDYIREVEERYQRSNNCGIKYCLQCDRLIDEDIPRLLRIIKNMQRYLKKEETDLGSRGLYDDAKEITKILEYEGK